MNFSRKLIALSDLPAWRKSIRQSRKKLVATNGCFDLLHLGHATYLESARAEGDLLLVGVNGDAGVRELKGPGRPINHEQDRALLLAALEFVDAVCIFPEVRATQFLSLAEPDVYVKGGDYTLETLDQQERQAIERAGGTIRIIPLVPGKSTTNLVQKIGTR